MRPKIEVEIKAHSINPDGQEILTALLTMPRYALAEFNTHRLFSRNAASSRALPVTKLRAIASEDPQMPFIWGKNQRGMQSFDLVDLGNATIADALWRQGGKDMAELSRRLEELGLHKQWANRPMEAFLPVTVLMTTTELGNFFNLRAHMMALPDFGQLAYLLLWHHHRSVPVQKKWGEWHMPFAEHLPKTSDIVTGLVTSLNAGGLKLDGLYTSDGNVTYYQLLGALKIATARCARLSYLTFDGMIDMQQDFRLHDDLAKNGHWSPFEHCAMAEPYIPYPGIALHCGADSPSKEFFKVLLDRKMIHEDHGNFKGWKPLRKHYPNEHQSTFDYNELMSNKPDWIQLPNE